MKSNKNQLTNCVPGEFNLSTASSCGTRLSWEDTVRHFLYNPPDLSWMALLLSFVAFGCAALTVWHLKAVGAQNRLRYAGVALTAAAVGLIMLFSAENLYEFHISLRVAPSGQIIDNSVTPSSLTATMVIAACIVALLYLVTALYERWLLSSIGGFAVFTGMVAVASQMALSNLNSGITASLLLTSICFLVSMTATAALVVIGAVRFGQHRQPRASLEHEAAQLDRPATATTVDAPH